MDGGNAAEWQIEAAGRIADIPAADWDACAQPPGAAMNPFVTHAFLKALEDSGSVGPGTGWAPAHLVLKRTGGGIAAVMPCYLKSHSYGEYVFDHAWAAAYRAAGGLYYPKLQTAVPFTPVTGPRLLIRDGIETGLAARLLTGAAVELARVNHASSWHVTFAPRDEWETLGELGLLQRNDTQYHWQNEGYATFDDFLAALASRKRKTVRKERAQARESGIEIEWVTGRDITESHWDAFFDFYLDTGSRKWGSPYLNRAFFSLAGAAMSESILLVMCKRGGRYIAGALNFIGSDRLYGRYWGCIETHPFLHFEACYYQAIDYAIAHRLAYVEAGAQGEHKLARGYVPETTYSLHWFADPGLAQAVSRFLDQERRAVGREQALLAEMTPFRKPDCSPRDPEA
jgi:predicted N-acyltransferase